MPEEKRDTAVGLSRNLIDALETQIDSGVIIPKEESVLRRDSILDYVPNRSDILGVQKDVLIGIECFQGLSIRFGLPTHNAVAFFEAAIEKEKELRAPGTDRECFRSLIHLALSGQGFLFGTAFDGEQHMAVRPCDTLESFKIPDKIRAEFQWVSLENNALLAGAVYFQKDYRLCQKVIDDLRKQSEIVSQWYNMDRTIKSGDATFSEEDIRDFFRIYRQYCLEQTGRGTTEERSVCLPATEQKILRDLRYIEESIDLLIPLDRLVHRLEIVLKTPDESLRLKEKNRWLDDFYRWLNCLDQKKLEHTVEIAQRERDLDQKLVSQLGLKVFFKAAESAQVPKDQERDMPILNRKVANTFLCHLERQALYEYRKHPIYQCFCKVQVELSKEWVAEAGPVYLAHWFINKQEPRIPLLKRSYRLGDKHIQIATSVKAETDWRLSFFQQCHFRFFHELCKWYENVQYRNPTLSPCNQKLCDALYARCRNQLVKQNWLAVGGRSILYGTDSEIPIFKLYQQLNGVFDFHIPVYAKSICRTDNLFYFFYEKQDQRVVKVKRKIRKLLEHDEQAIVKQYKQIALLDPDGIGHGIMPLKWHRKLAEFLESVIKSDPDVEAYVIGDTDPCYPGSNIRLSELNETIQAEKDTDKYFPEDIQPYLSIVEWYIQKVCADMIAADLQPRVLSMCKRLFLEDR